MVRQRGGTSNDGNTSRRFFRDTKFASETTGIDETLMKRFKVILVTLSCGKYVDSVKFAKYATETAELYNKLYKWYYMPVSVHKVILMFVKKVFFFKLIYYRSYFMELPSSIILYFQSAPIPKKPRSAEIKILRD